MAHRERHRSERIGWLRAAELVAGALSMAAGEYVSVSSRADTEKADLPREWHELAIEPRAEENELTWIDVRRGLDAARANHRARPVRVSCSAERSRIMRYASRAPSATRNPTSAATTAAARQKTSRRIRGRGMARAHRSRCCSRVCDVGPTVAWHGPLVHPVSTVGAHPVPKSSEPCPDRMALGRSVVVYFVPARRPTREEWVRAAFRREPRQRQFIVTVRSRPRGVDWRA